MKISDKLDKVNDCFSISRYDNGFMIEISGRTAEEDYKTAKLIVKTVDELLDLVKEAVTLKLDD